jgi:GNAT superfamily N-acetyltransferase
MVQVVRTTCNHPDFRLLVSKLEQELRDRYGAIQDLYEPYNRVADINTVVLVYNNTDVIGCGCFKHHDENTIEIKRMFVEQNHRGKGISKIVLNTLEVWARELGYTRCILETGAKQPESIGLYTSLGYHQIENYEPYMDMVESICYGKTLVP